MRSLLLLALLVLNVGRASARPPGGRAEEQASARPAFEAGIAHVIALPNDTGNLNIEPGRGFAAHAEVFWTSAFSTRAAATFVNPAAYTPEVDLGTLGLDIYSATARWHLRPRSRFSAFAGAGGALVMIGDLDDQFGDEIEIEFDSQVAPVVEAGVRYRVYPRIVLELSATYIPLEATGDAIDPRVPRTIAVDPLIVSVAAAWRF